MSENEILQETEEDAATVNESGIPHYADDNVPSNYISPAETEATQLVGDSNITENELPEVGVDGYSIEEIQELITEIQVASNDISSEILYIYTAQVVLLSFIAALLLVLIFAVVWGRH